MLCEITTSCGNEKERKRRATKRMWMHVTREDMMEVGAVVGWIKWRRMIGNNEYNAIAT